ncbi:MAG: hypothetical protein PHT16_00825 [Candidatus Pacebacteria bacterium]|nr:hypothetical protein [Candidatus Paceibacterota bacterium]
MNSETRVCQNCKKDFTIEPEDFSFYEKLKVPAPTWCPDCRFVRKLTFINERSLYKETCGNCKKSIISMYSPESGISSWCIKCHLSDVWDARDYGREYDFSKTFFEQFKELKYNIPHRALDQNERNGEGCEYSNLCFANKDVYLSFNIVGSEHIKYSNNVLKRNKNCLDSMIIKANDRGYELVQASNNYNSTFLIESDQCVDSHFLYDCSNCVKCCLSCNLRNKSNVFKNQQLSKEKYEEAVTNLKLETYSGQIKAKDIFRDLAKNAIHKHAHIKNSVNVVGDFVENSKNVYHCYCVADAENVKYVFFSANAMKDSQDVVSCGKIEECYEFTLGGRGSNRVVLCLSCGGGNNNLFYCDNVRSSSNCFGCVNLIKKQYCIFNKQYSKEEYFELLSKIMKHMNEMPYVDALGREYVFGEFFPTEISPFAYNETRAFEECPLSKEEVLAFGYKWKEIEAKAYVPTIKGDAIPDSIKDVEDTICDEVIECPNKGKVETRCTSAYKILPDELSFYRQMNLPIPRYCPNCRYHQRLAWKNPFHFYKRECMCELQNHQHKGKCLNKFETMYASDRPEIIYCKECYQAEIY